MKKIFSIAMAILIVFTAAMTAEGERLTTPEELGKIKKAADVDPNLTISAKSAILIERSTGTVIFEHDADKQMPPASITKIMKLREANTRVPGAAAKSGFSRATF